MIIISYHRILCKKTPNRLNNAIGRHIAWLHDLVRSVNNTIGESDAGASELQKELAGNNKLGKQ